MKVCNGREISLFQITKEAMYVQCNIEVRLQNDCCPGKAVSITHSEHVFAASVIPHALYYCHLWPSSPIFFHLISSTAQFLEKFAEYIMCVLIFSTIFVGNISHYKKNSVKYHHKCTQVFMYNTCYLSDFHET
jgi:hypothetical protein